MQAKKLKEQGRGEDFGAQVSMTESKIRKTREKHI